MRTESFFVPGEPKTKGSWIPIRRGRHMTVIPDNKKSKNWEKVVAGYALAKWGNRPEAGPVSIEMTFHLTRPRSHYGTGRNQDTIKASSPAEPIGHNTGDIDKLTRCVLDALTGIVYKDDSQVTCNQAQKMYAIDEAGVLITIGTK